MISSCLLSTLKTSKDTSSIVFSLFAYNLLPLSLFSSVMMSDSNVDNTQTVIILLFILVLLVLLLLYLYKRLNYETKDEYTIQRLVLGEGGLRDRVIQGIAVVETRLGDCLRSQTHDEEQALSSNEAGDGEEGEEEDAGQDHSENENKTEEKDQEHCNSSDDYSSIDLKERVKKNNSKENEEEQEEEEEDDVAKDEAKGDDSKKDKDVKDEERVGLLVDLKTFSGSAIWSGEKTEETNITAL